MFSTTLNFIMNWLILSPIKYCFSCFHKTSVSTVTYAKQHTRLLSNCPISPCSNSNPGHSTKFVTLPSSIFLYRFYMFEISYCNHQLMWLVLLLLCGHKWDSSSYENVFCAINHDEITWVTLVVYWFILLIFTISWFIQ